jgi:predicted transposase YdaD
MEVQNMCIIEFNQEVYERGLRQEGYESGRKELIQVMLHAGRSPEEIAEFCNIDLDEIKKAEQNV